MIVTGDHQKIDEVITSLAMDVRNLLKGAIEISYFSRGAWSYDSVVNKPPLIRDIMVEFINTRLEAASKSPYPVY